MAKRKCKCCGKRFDPDEAISFFEEETGEEYWDEFDEYCGECAVEDWKMNYGDDESNGMPVGCRACGSDTYPMCMQGCAIFDDE